jgi:hypothetical protein
MSSIDVLRLKAHCAKEYRARRNATGYRFNAPQIVALVGEADGVSKRTSRHEVVHVLVSEGQIELTYYRNMSADRFEKFMGVLNDSTVVGPKSS